MPNVDGGVADNGIDHEANQRLVPLLRTDARQESLHARIRIARDIYIYIKCKNKYDIYIYIYIYILLMIYDILYIIAQIAIRKELWE